MSDKTQRPRRQLNWSRIAKNSSAGAVASIAGYASYWHQVHVATLAGERTELAHIIPVSVDGVLVVASVAMVDAAREGRRPSWATRVGFVVGIAASVGANVMSAQPTLLGRAVAAWPAVALLLVVEMLSRKGKLLPKEESPTERAQLAAPVAVVAEEAEQVQVPDTVAELESPDRLREAPVSPAPAGRPIPERTERRHRRGK
jgi:hypothetical protein